MGKPCTICKHPKVDKINRDLKNTGRSFKKISETYCVAETALRGHKGHLLEEEGELVSLRFEEQSAFWKRYRAVVGDSLIAELNLRKDYSLVNTTLKLKKGG